jgi:hypothetical protein
MCKRMEDANPCPLNCAAAPQQTFTEPRLLGCDWGTLTGTHPLNHFLMIVKFHPQHFYFVLLFF